MKTVSNNNLIYAFDRNNEPVLRVEAPDQLVFETNDCFNNQITNEDMKLEKLNFDQINPATGPVYVEGLNPGDVLQVTIKEIAVGNQAVMIAEPGEGVLGDKIGEPTTKVIPIKDNQAWFYDDLPLPLNKMIGVIGVAPEGEPVSTGTPGTHGGNMDNILITEGSTIYFPVFVPGGLLAMGDLHAVMGDGEIVVTGAEINGRVTVEIEVVKDLNLKNPLVRTADGILATVASDQDLDQAVDQATIEMADLLAEHAEIPFNEIGMLMSVVGQTKICQVVDPLKTARFEMPDNILQRIGFKL